MNRRLDEIGSELERELGALLGSVNFSGYSDRARVRSDDLAVRAVAGRDVLSAKGSVGEMIAGWWSARAGEPTREKPFPEPALSAKLRALRAFEQRLAQLESEIRGASAPDIDVVWSRRSDGMATLQMLLGFDRALLAQASRLAETARALRIEDLDGEPPFTALDALVGEFTTILRDRQRALASS